MNLRLTAVCSALLIVTIVKAQVYTEFGFEDAWELDYIELDTSNSVWRIGEIDKDGILPYSGSKVIATLLDTSYPVMDTSSFTIWQAPSAHGWGWLEQELGGMYWSDTDTLTDYCFVEFSFDHGASWIDLVNHPEVTDDFNGSPVISGNSDGWKVFRFVLSGLFTSEGVEAGDTLYYRFVFHSDSVESFKSGVVFDDIYFLDFYSGIVEESETALKCYPNPAAERVYLESTYALETECLLIDNTGSAFRSILEGSSLDLSSLSPGTYTLIASHAGSQSSKLGCQIIKSK